MRGVNGTYRFLIILLVLLGSTWQSAIAQEKHRVRLKADYVKYMETNCVLNIAASARIDKRNVDLPGLDLSVVNEVGEEEIMLGTVQTDHSGEAQMNIDLGALKADSLDTYTLSVKFQGADSLRRASRSVTFRDAAITARMIVRDSVHTLEAILKDTAKDSLLSDQNVIVQVERLFAPLLISDEINMTDEFGTILVAIPEGIPGVDGNLKLETVLEDSDDYGTVKAILNAPVGVPIADESGFDDRTLWSPRNKTPIFILLFTGLLILATWGTIFYLIRILYQIAKQ